MSVGRKCRLGFRCFKKRVAMHNTSGALRRWCFILLRSYSTCAEGRYCKEHNCIGLVEVVCGEHEIKCERRKAAVLSLTGRFPF